eukprot:scaffold47821_cov79-Attheya_sp.AAC.1
MSLELLLPKINGVGVSKWPVLLGALVLSFFDCSGKMHFCVRESNNGAGEVCRSGPQTFLAKQIRFGAAIFSTSLTRAHNLSSLRKWPLEPSEWKHRNKSQSRLATATPTVDNPDRQRYAVSLRLCCTDASSITAGTIDVIGGDGFVDISLVEDPALKMGGCGACGKGKGRNGGKRGETVFWGDTKPVAGGGVWRSRLAKESGLNEE